MSDESRHLARLIWSVSDLLRGDFKASEYGKIILPFTVLRRLDCVLAPTRTRVQDVASTFTGDEPAREAFLRRASGQPFFNTSRLTLEDVASSPQDAPYLLRDHIAGLSDNAREVMERFEIDQTIKRLHDSDLLYLVISKFVTFDLGPAVTSHQMGLVFEELVRHFAEYGSETAGEHLTPRDVVRLMVSLLTAPDTDVLTAPGVIRSVLDPVCGTGGLLSEAEDHITAINPQAHVVLCGQEINAETWAICRSDMMMRGLNPDNIAFGNVLSHDGHRGETFDYLLANPPFGVDWKKVAYTVRDEHDALGFRGRFGAGLPRINDGSLLFLQHMLSKMKTPDASGFGGSRVAVIFNGSPMHVGAPGSGESEIRKWVIENDWLEAVVALPDQLFHNTSINTYLWVLSNRKSTELKGSVVLVNAQDQWQKMRSTVGNKRKYIGPDQINEIARIYQEALYLSPELPQDRVRVVRNEELGYRRITIEQPLRLRYELSADSLSQLAASRFVQRVSTPDALLASLTKLQGSTWSTSSAAFSAMRQAVESDGHSWPGGTGFDKAVRKAIGVRDGQGEIQRSRGSTEPDLELRTVADLALHENPDDYLQREVHPRAPRAWIDHSRTKVGYGITPALFLVAEFDGPVEPLRHFAQLETARITPQRDDPDGAGEPGGHKHLRAQDLYQVDSVVELPDAPKVGPALTPCSGGDLVGRPGKWRLLPASFGEAATSLFVLRPLRGSGWALCEWLNSLKENGQFPNARDLLDLPVPVELVGDEEVDDLLTEVQEGRRTLRSATSGILPNIFTDSESDIQQLREQARSAAYEARLVGELVRPLSDPVWRAEWSYPYHAAALAHRYRISTHPAERKDGLLKLGEGIARTLGLLALSEIVASEGFTSSLRNKFRTGATFGTWLTLIDRLPSVVGSPRLRELSTLHGRTRPLLGQIKDFRNDSHHAHGVRATHELDEDVDKLEPYVVSAISSVSWLSGTHWDWVERCEYVDESSYKVVGLRLRGSHPSWEPFERSSTYPLRPDRIYIDSTPSGSPVDLWPLAAVKLCPECRTRELFLLNQVRDGKLTLRSLEEHTLEIPDNQPW
ncbi:type I restriction-modification system subunit M [Streptomyces sp. NPDC054987]